ncbi:MAG: glutamate racemase [Erysipelotrichaceae bacterium]|nr:glutamate racemase [Erysipelotrichaceae bacterium]
MSEQYIGVFDSGVGGLTVFKSIMESMPSENLLYFGDTAHVPYGTKSEKQIRKFVLNDVAFLHRFPLKAIVIACNTADSVAGQLLRETYPEEKIFGVIEPAAAEAVRSTVNKKIGIMATKATVASKAYDRAILAKDPTMDLISVPCPLLVPLVENGRFEKDDPVVRMVLSEYLEPLIRYGVDTIVLGCTHYPLLKEAIQSLAPEIHLISSSDAAAKVLKEAFPAEEGQGIRRYFVSDDRQQFADNASRFIPDLQGEIEQVTLE